MAADTDEFDTEESAGAQPPPAVSGTMPKALAPETPKSGPAQSAPTPPPPVTDSSASKDEKDEEAGPPTTSTKTVWDDADRRHVFGLVCGIVGSLVVILVLVWTPMHASDALAEIRSAAKDQTLGPAVEHAVWISIAAHAVVAVAAIFFAYQMIRLAERMYVPRHLLQDERSLEVVRALVGVNTPAKAAADTIKDVAENVAAALKPLAEALRPLAEFVRAASGADKEKK